MATEVTFKKNEDEVIVHTTKNDVKLNMSNKVFDSLQKIINGDYTVVEDDKDNL